MVKKIIIAFLLGILAVAAYSFFSFKKTAVLETEALPSRTSERGGVEFKATPVGFEISKPVRFGISIDTHSGSLDFDLAEIATLEDDLGNRYLPNAWEGSAPGGHHRSGTLVFPQLESGAGHLTLSIKDDPDLEPRVFKWSLKQ